ncbi:MAG: histidine kinase [Bacteroidota bacterium]
MRLFNKKRRVQYLAFDDVWFVVFGIILLSFVTDFLFSGSSFSRLPFLEATINWSVSLTFATLNWLVMRTILIAIRKRYPRLNDAAKRIALFFFFIVVTVCGVDYLGNFSLGLIFGQGYNHPLRSKLIVPIILISTMTMAIYEAIYFYYLLKQSIREEEQAKNAVVQAQLDALRNQAQPHFFFNTLNTLRDIIDQNTKAEAKEFVDRLSEVYRFILESGDANLITLQEELRFAKAYLHIQKERFGDSLRVAWNIPESQSNKLIVPMSLQLLLENAIKHNVISRTHPLLIKVAVANEELYVENKIKPRSTQLPTTGLGLGNIERRYTLISNKAISISKMEGYFKVCLPLLSANDQKYAYASTYH